MLCQKDNSIASGAQLSNVLIVISDILGFGAMNEELFLDLDCFFLHSNKSFFNLNNQERVVYNLGMNSTSELEKRVQNLKDEIKDIFHATKLNLEALSVQLHSYNESKVTLSTLAHCQKEFENIEQLFEERDSLRLEYLITQQIKQEEAKVRRERLVEYEEKIYDQRRLIADKETFYEGLLKPRRRRPPHMTIEEFHALRRQELIAEERKNLKRLEEETCQLKLMQRILKNDNDELQKASRFLQKEELSKQQIQLLQRALQMNPVMYESIHNLPSRKQDITQLTKLYQNITKIDQSCNDLHKQYLEERQLYQYLKWEHNKLKDDYLQKQEQRRQKARKERKNYQKVTKYKLLRSSSI